MVAPGLKGKLPSFATAMSPTDMDYSLLIIPSDAIRKLHSVVRAIQPMPEDATRGADPIVPFVASQMRTAISHVRAGRLLRCLVLPATDAIRRVVIRSQDEDH